MKQEKRKGGFRKLVRLYTSIPIPWYLYLFEVVLGVLSTKIALEYVDYQSQLKLGNFEDTGVVTGYVVTLLLNSLISMLAAVPAFYSAAIVNRNLQNKLISRALRLPMRSFEKNGSQMVGWITQDSANANGLITSLVGFLTGAVSMFLSISEMSSIDAAMVSIVPFVVVYVLFSTWIEGKLLFLRQRADRRANAELTAFFSEHMGFFHQVRQLHAEKEELKRGKQAIKAYYKLSVYQSVLTLVGNFVSGPITSFINIMVFVLGVPRVRSGAIAMTDLVAFQSYILIAYNNFTSLLRLYTEFMYYSGTLYYISDLMDEKEEVYKRERTMDVPDADVHFETVSFGYEDKKVIENATFTIPKGKLTIVTGPNGTGKTTLFRLLQRFYTPDVGKLRFGDIPAESIHLDEWRQSIAYVLQEPQLFDGTVRENIVYGMNREVSDEEVQAAASLAVADHFIQELPGGYDFVIGDNGSKLSAGQRQRIAIARALLLDPDYLLLDEATCNVDVCAERSIIDGLLARMQGRTIVMISHDMDMLKRADHIIVLNRGGVEACGPRDAVMESSATLKKLITADLERSYAS